MTIIIQNIVSQIKVGHVYLYTLILLSFNFIFFIQCILIILFPLPQLLSDPSHFPTHPTPCLFPRKTIKMEINMRKKHQNKTENAHKRNMESILHCQLLLGPPCSVVDVLNDSSLEKTDFSFPANINGK